MNDTIKLNGNFKGMVAHRGAGLIETENTLRAFKRAALKSYVGMECDIHLSRDRKLVVSHDGNLMRVGGVFLDITKHTYEEIKAVKLKDINTSEISEDLYCPLLDEFLDVCKEAHKRPVIELKETLDREAVLDLIETVKKKDMLKEVIFISFYPGYLTKIRELCPDVEIEFLTQEYTKSILDICIQFNFGIDAYYKEINEEVIKDFHKNGLKVNVYTVDHEEDAYRLISYGIDYITSNILE